MKNRGRLPDRGMASLLDSDRPVLQLGRADDVVISRAEWDLMQKELAEMRESLSRIRAEFTRIGKSEIPPELHHVIKTASRIWDRSLPSILGYLKFDPLPMIRMAIYRVARTKEVSTADIAKAFRRDRGTIGYWEVTARDLNETSVLFRNLCQQLEAACN